MLPLHLGDGGARSDGKGHIRALSRGFLTPTGTPFINLILAALQGREEIAAKEISEVGK